MASYNTVITNEGAALLASVIANQGTLTFSEMRFSTTDYDGVEQTLTVGTFGGVFITAAASGSVVDATTIKVESQFDNSGIVGDHPLYSIGIVGTDGNTTALIAVCTTTNPDIIRAAMTGVSTYAFNVNLAVSSTSNITVTGTTAAVLYDTDIVNHLNSTDATKPLSANMGHVLGEEVNALVNMYGSKNLLPRMQGGTHTSNTVVFTFNDDGSITANGTATGGNATCFRFFDTLPKAGIAYTLTGGTAAGKGTWVDAYNNGVYVRTIGWSAPDADTFTPDYVGYNQLMWGVYIESGQTCTNETFYPMLRDARIVDPTYEPYAETNQQLTVNKANRNELPHENLLRNAYFMGGGSQQGGHQFPINSRALTSYPSGTRYTIDRWVLDSAGNNPSLTVDSDGITLTHYSVVGTYSLFQYIDDYEQYIGKTFTISFLGSLLEGSGFSIVAWYHPFTTDWRGDYKAFTSLSNDIASMTFTVPNNAEGLAIIITALDSYSPYKVKFKAAKLELGNYQTLAHGESGSWVLNDTEPNFAVELAKCRASKGDPYDTYANKGNLVNYDDLASLNLQGTKNTTGTIIPAGTYFYLNGQYCIAIQDIGNNADYTENTNYVVTSIGGELRTKRAIRSRVVTYASGCVGYNGSAEEVVCTEFSDGSVLVNGIFSVTNTWEDTPNGDILFTLPDGVAFPNWGSKQKWFSFNQLNGGGVVNGSCGIYGRDFKMWGQHVADVKNKDYIVNFSW